MRTLDWRTQRADADRRRAAPADDPADDDGARPARRGVHARHRDRRPRARPAAPDRAAAGDRADAAQASPACSSRTTSCWRRSPRRSGSRAAPAWRSGCRRARPTRSARPPPAAEPGLLAVALLIALVVVAARDRAARLARGADAGPGRARARPRRHLGARLARGRGSRGGCACRSWSASAPRTRSPSAGARSSPSRASRWPPRWWRPRWASRRRWTASRATRRCARSPTSCASSPRCRPPRSTACSPAAARSTAVARVREIVMTGRGRTEIHARVLDGPLDAFPYAIRDGARPARTGEVTLGRGALDALDAQIGDTRRPARRGQPVSLRVVGRHVEPDDDGRGAVDEPEQPARRRRQARRPYWAVRLSPGADPVATAAALRREGHGRLASSARSSRSSARRPTCARSSTARSRC